MPRLALNDQIVSVGARTKLAGGWVEGGSVYSTFIDEASTRDRCPSSRYFMVGEVVTAPDQ